MKHVSQHVNHTYSQKRKLLNKVRELEAEVKALENENNHITQIEKENLMKLAQGRIPVPNNIHPGVSENSKAASKESTDKQKEPQNPSITCSSNNAISTTQVSSIHHPQRVQNSSIFISEHPSSVTNVISGPVHSSTDKHPTVKTVSSSSYILPNSSNIQISAGKGSTPQEHSIRSLLQANGDALKSRSKNEIKPSTAKSLLTNQIKIIEAKPTFKPVNIKPVNGLKYSVLTTASGGVGKPSLPISISLDKNVCVKDSRNKPSLPVSIPLDKALRKDLKEKPQIQKMHVTNCKGDATQGMEARGNPLLNSVLEIDKKSSASSRSPCTTMYSPISRPSSRGSTTDTADETHCESGRSSVVSNVSRSPAYSSKQVRPVGQKSEKNVSGVTVNSLVENVLKAEICQVKQQMKKDSGLDEVANTLIQMSESKNHVHNNIANSGKMNYRAAKNEVRAIPQYSRSHNNSASIPSSHRQLKRKSDESGAPQVKKSKPELLIKATPPTYIYPNNVSSMANQPLGITAISSPDSGKSSPHVQSPLFPNVLNTSQKGQYIIVQYVNPVVIPNAYNTQ